MDELLRILEHECRRLEYVRYRTSVVLLLLQAGESRFLPRATDEIHAAVDELGEVELLRASLVSRVAEELGVPEDLMTLSALTRSAPAVAAGHLRDLQERLRAELTELHRLTGESSTVATTELDSIRRSLGRWSGATHVPQGYVLASSPAPARFDGSL